MKEKKILFKLENDDRVIEINGLDKVELLSFICEALETLIEKGIVSREELLTSINICLTLGAALSKEKLNNKELSDFMPDLFRGITND